MIQASRYTPEELAMLAYWESKGYTFRRGEKPPMNTITAPSFATRHPKADAILNGVVLILGGCALIAFCLAVGSGLIR